MLTLHRTMLKLTANHRKLSRQTDRQHNNLDFRFMGLTNNTWKPLLRATSIILFLVMPGNIVPFIAGVEITLPWSKQQEKK